MQDDGHAGLVGGTHSDPAKPSVPDVVADLETENVPVEGQRSVRVRMREECPVDGDVHGGSAILDQAEDVAVRVGECGHEAAAPDISRGLLQRRTGSGDFGELRLDIRHVPVRDGRGHPTTAWYEPDLLSL